MSDILYTVVEPMCYNNHGLVNDSLYLYLYLVFNSPITPYDLAITSFITPSDEAFHFLFNKDLHICRKCLLNELIMIDHQLVCGTLDVETYREILVIFRDICLNSSSCANSHLMIVEFFRLLELLHISPSEHKEFINLLLEHHRNKNCPINPDLQNCINLISENTNNTKTFFQWIVERFKSDIWNRYQTINKNPMTPEMYELLKLRLEYRKSIDLVEINKSDITRVGTELVCNVSELISDTSTSGSDSELSFSIYTYGTDSSSESSFSIYTYGTDSSSSSSSDFDLDIGIINNDNYSTVNE